MAQIKVKDASGERTLHDAGGRPLMELLRDASTAVQGICGGMCSCGTCHVYVKDAWLAKLPPKGPDEEAMLEAIGELVEVRPTSRLSCQILLTEALDGLEVEVGPLP